MLVYAVVSPKVFMPPCFEHAGYLDQLALFFRGLQGNSVLLLDSDASLLDDIEAAVATLAIKFRQDLEIRLAELRKNLRDKKQRKSVVRSVADKCNTSKNQSCLKRCMLVARACCPDALFLSDDEIRQVELDGIKLPIARMSEYSRSDFEEKRRRFMEGLPAVDQLDPGEFDDLIIRATRFSAWLRVFDKQIGKGQNVSNFRRGIERILLLWIKHAHVSPQRVEVITAEAEVLDEDANDFVLHRKRTRILKCIQNVKEALGAPLSAQFSQEIRITVKQDPQKIFHARHLQTQTTILLVERGFDIQNDNGTLRRNFLKLDLGAQAHLIECRDLAESSIERDEGTSGKTQRT